MFESNSSMRTRIDFFYPRLSIYHPAQWCCQLVAMLRKAGTIGSAESEIGTGACPGRSARIGKNLGAVGWSYASHRGHLVADTPLPAGCARWHMQPAAGEHAAIGVLVGETQKGPKASIYTTTAAINQCCRRMVKQYDVASIIDGNPSSSFRDFSRSTILRPEPGARFSLNSAPEFPPRYVNLICHPGWLTAIFIPSILSIMRTSCSGKMDILNRRRWQLNVQKTDRWFS